MTGPLRTIAVLAAATGDALLNTLAGSRRHRTASSTPPVSQLVVFEIIPSGCGNRTIGHWSIEHWGIDQRDLEHWGIENWGIDYGDPENWDHSNVVD
ncbi:MAG TPA: hypothetical protein VFE65_07570 [Pseudonocardia sp.]|jgi:hypothetical protein|nr:hypothetical protein [Pseudonocardia sp.]